MSNVICIQPCKFIDRVNSKNVTSYGYRCYDHQGSCYNNLWEKKHINMSSIEIFKKIYKERKDDVELDIMLDFAIHIKGDICIGDDILEWEQIRDVIEV